MNRTQLSLRPVRDVLFGRHFFSEPGPGCRPRRAHLSVPPLSSTEILQSRGRSAARRHCRSRSSPATIRRWQRNMRRARRLTPRACPVMIQGPTGAGKEIFARALHAASDRDARTFVALNCAAIPETLIESELFGHAAGASHRGLQGRHERQDPAVVRGHAVPR